MKITERRLRQIIRQVIKESKLHERGGEGAVIAGIGVLISIKLASLAAVGLVDLYHVIKDNIMHEYCEMTGGTDPMLSVEDFEDFLDEGLTISFGNLHGGDVLILESIETGTKVVVALEDTGGMRRPSNERRYIADLIGRAYTGDQSFDSTDIVMPRRKGRSSMVDGYSQYDPTLVQIVEKIYGRYSGLSQDFSFDAGGSGMHSAPAMSNESYIRRARRRYRS